MTTTFLRTLCPTENRLYLLNLIVPHNVVFVAKFSGKLDDDTLRLAIKNLQKRFPVLNVCIENEAIYSPKFCLLPETTLIPLVVEYNDKIQNSWEERAERLLSEQLDQHNAPLFKAIKVNFKEGFYLFFSLQHFICDGISIASLFKNLLLEINKPKTTAQTRDEHVSEYDFAPPIQELLPNLPNGDLSGSLFDNPNENDYRKLYLHIPVAKRSTGFVNLILSEEQLAIIRKRCTEKQASFHAFLCSCICKALRKNLFHFKYDSEKNLRIGCNTLINVRSYLEIPLNQDILGFYSSCILSGYELNIDTNIWQLTKIIQDDIAIKKRSLDFIKRMKRHEILVNKYSVPELLIESMRVDEPTVSISNMGKIDIEFTNKNCSVADFNIISTCHAHSRNQDTFFVTITTFNGKFSLNLHYVKPIVSYERAKIIINEIQKTLLENI